MREIEEEKAARTRERMMQEEAKREEERRMRQRKLEEADSLLNHAEEALDSCKSPSQVIRALSLSFVHSSCTPNHVLCQNSTSSLENQRGHA
jgi:IS30 family transposase